MNIQTAELRKYFEHNGISQVVISEKTGLPKGTVSSILSGRYNMGNKTAKKIADAFGFNFDFVRYGTGELVKRKPTPTIQQNNQQGDNIGVQINAQDSSSPSHDPDAEFWKKKYSEAVLRIAVLEAENESLKGK